MEIMKRIVKYCIHWNCSCLNALYWIHYPAMHFCWNFGISKWANQRARNKRNEFWNWKIFRCKSCFPIFAIKGTHQVREDIRLLDRLSSSLWRTRAPHACLLSCSVTAATTASSCPAHFCQKLWQLLSHASGILEETKNPPFVPRPEYNRDNFQRIWLKSEGKNCCLYLCH